jgi:hypothetical protein
MGEQQLNELKRIMGTVDGRDFIYNFALYSCGVDYSSGIPSGLASEYNSGVRKPAIDLFNLLVYHCYDNFKLMLQEQELRRNSNG